jgi:alpha-L-fucosidase
MTGPYAPCIDPDQFYPDQLDADQWMAASAAMGMKEVVITAQHEGGFCLWNSSVTNYTAPNTPWGKKTGRNVLAEFVEAAHRWGIRVAYYFNIQCSGYNALVEKLTAEQWVEVQLGKLRELLTPPYTPSRLWFDGTHWGVPANTNLTAMWDRAMPIIREMSPSTIVSAYRGDVCYRPLTSAYGCDGPHPNSSDASGCVSSPNTTGPYFTALESHGVTMQQGPDGDEATLPTYWFWHDAVGFGPASRLFDAFLATVGHGKTLNLNIAPNMTGLMTQGVVDVMTDFGDARNRTFGTNLGLLGATSGGCGTGHESDFVLDVSSASPAVTVGALDYVSTREDLGVAGQRIQNYTVEYQVAGDSKWQTLVPAPTCYPWQDKHCVNAPNCNLNSTERVESTGPLGDAPSASYPRDAYIGNRRFDCPKAAGGPALPSDSTVVTAVRFVCIEAIVPGEPVHIRDFSIHQHQASFLPPWGRN